MLLYDMESSIDWFYDGNKSFEDMAADEQYHDLFAVPCVLFDDGCGKIYGFDTLENVALRFAVPYIGGPEQVFNDVKAKEAGTYKAPGVAEAQAVAEEAEQAADTAAASVNEYMDALLGLDTTDETEATDAE